MFTTPFKLIPAALLMLALQAPAALAQPAPGMAERLHANAVSSFRKARFSEAYGRFISLADAGHAPAAEQALWMYRHGASLFGKEWDCSPDQLAAWARLTGQPVPVMVATAPTSRLTPVASRTR